MKKFRLAMVLLAFCFSVARAEEIGAARDFDLQKFIDGAIKAGEKQIVVPPGRYRVTPAGRSHLSFINLADISIVADGVEMVCTRTVSALDFRNCRNVHLKGLTIDYDPLPYTEARIVALAPDKSWVEFEIIDGYPENQLKERVEIFDPATRELRRETGGWAKEIQSLGNHRYRISKPAAYRYRGDWDTEQVGDILVTQNCFPDNAGHHAITAEGCTGLKLEDITLYASSSFGFLEDGCDGSTYLRCKIDRRLPESDPVKRGFPRMRSLNADAFHSIGAAKGPAIIGCGARFQGDDCVNIHGVYDLITAVSGDQLRVALLRDREIKPGDPVEFLPFDGPRPPDAVVQKIEGDAPITEGEKDFIRKLNLYPPHKERLLGGGVKFFKLTLDHPVTLPAWSAICSGKNVGNGFLVKDCDFGYNRSRGILIKASRGQVIDNTISHGWMAAVLVSPEYWWLEAASSSDVVISGNKIVGCRRPAIEIAAPGGNGKPLPSGAHRDISITDNSITQSVWPNIRVTSTDRLVIRNNRLTPADPAEFIPPIAHPWSWGTVEPSPVLVEFCDHPDVRVAP